MGHKEQLLEGAKQCLYEKGFARTTARDIVAASGTNLASIGYHYGSKEALLNAAMIAAIGDWFDHTLPPLPTGGEGDPLDAFQAMWSAVVESFGRSPQMWAASIEAFTQAARSQELMGQLAHAHVDARVGLAAAVLGVPEEDVTPEQASSLGSLLLALVPGVMVQHLVDPERAPNGRDLADGIRLLTRGG